MWSYATSQTRSGRSGSQLTESQLAAEPLSAAEEAALAFAAAGVTGFALSELPFQTGQETAAGGGHIMVHFVGRTIASGDAMYLTAVFVVNDEGAWMLRRPRTIPVRISWSSCSSRGPGGSWSSMTERGSGWRPAGLTSRDGCRLSLNKWSANAPGTTYFVPIAELTVFYINVLLSFLDRGVGILFR